MKKKYLLMTGIIISSMTMSTAASIQTAVTAFAEEAEETAEEAEAEEETEEAEAEAEEETEEADAEAEEEEEEETEEADAEAEEETEEADAEAEEEQSETPAHEYGKIISVDNIEDYIELGEYKGLELTKTIDYVSDDAVDSYIEEILASNQSSVDGEVQEGDTVNIDYVGKLDDVAFDGGTAEGYNLEIGSGTFIDGFEDGLIGVEKGSTVDLTLTFPEEYTNEDLAGQETVFTVTVNSIYRTAELTDEWVAAFDETESTTIDEYKAEVREILEDQAEENADSAMQNDAWTTVNNSSEVKEYPQDEIDRIKGEMDELMETYASQYGMEVDAFLEAQGYDDESYAEMQQEYAESRVKQNLIVQAIVDAEDIDLTDSVTKECEDYLVSIYGAEDIDQMIESYGEQEVAEIVVLLRVERFITDNAKVTEQISEDNAAEVDESEAEPMEEEASDESAEETEEE